ncbi:hypothetical protein JCM5350_002363 [Sporobolomyces pararoseus]
MGSVTVIGYGLTIMSTGLITAAQAWPHIEQTFKFFDLLLLRKRTGTLRMAMEESRIDNIPVEVWEEIRDWASQIQLEDEEDRILRKHFLQCEKEECRCHRIRKVIWNIIRDGLSECDASYNRFDSDELLDFMNKYRSGCQSAIEVSFYTPQPVGIKTELQSKLFSSQPIYQLVAYFGLAFPSDSLIPTSLSPEFLTTLAFITLPYRSQKSNTEGISVHGDHYEEPENALALVDLSFDLPPDANARLLRFVRTFDLEVVEHKNDTFRCVAPQIQTSSQGLRRINTDCGKVVPRDQVKPSWKLYIFSYEY